MIQRDHRIWHVLEKQQKDLVGNNSGEVLTGQEDQLKSWTLQRAAKTFTKHRPCRNPFAGNDKEKRKSRRQLIKHLENDKAAGPYDVPPKTIKVELKYINQDAAQVVWNDPVEDHRGAVTWMELFRLHNLYRLWESFWHHWPRSVVKACMASQRSTSC